MERDEQLIKFSYKFLKFASTVENYTNGAAQCSKLLPVGHEFEKVSPQLILWSLILSAGVVESEGSAESGAVLLRGP